MRIKAIEIRAGDRLQGRRRRLLRPWLITEEVEVALTGIIGWVRIQLQGEVDGHVLSPLELVRVKRDSVRSQAWRSR